VYRDDPNAQVVQSGEILYRAEIDFFLAQTDATAAGDHDGFVVEWIVDVNRRVVPD